MSELLDEAIGADFGNTIMKQSKMSKYSIDWKSTKNIRRAMATQKFVKITINLDAKSLSALKKESVKTGVPYQRLLNSLLRSGLDNRRETESRLDRVERELEKVKKRLAA